MHIHRNQPLNGSHHPFGIFLPLLNRFSRPRFWAPHTEKRPAGWAELHDSKEPILPPLVAILKSWGDVNFLHVCVCVWPESAVYTCIKSKARRNPKPRGNLFMRVKRLRWLMVFSGFFLSPPLAFSFSQWTFCEFSPGFKCVFFCSPSCVALFCEPTKSFQDENGSC